MHGSTAGPTTGLSRGAGGAGSVGEANNLTGKPKHPPDLLDNLFTHVNKTLLTFKLFYFFFFAAFGSLFPLISVYFKQLGMNATQCGLLVGFRPFIEFFAAPLWGSLADKLKRGKLFLLGSLFSWIVFTLIIGFVKPQPLGCLVRVNATVTDIKAPQANFPWNAVDHTHLNQLNVEVGQSPILLNANNFRSTAGQIGYDMVIPRYSTIVFSQDAVNKCFIILLVVMIIGEFFSSPAISLADSAVLNYLEEDKASYGRQRMYGSLGWGLTMLFIGIALDRSTMFANHPCGHAGSFEKNYVICFAAFTVFMSCAFMAATQFFFAGDTGDSMYLTLMKDKVRNKVMGQGRTLKARGKLVNEEEDKTQSQLESEDRDAAILECQLGVSGLVDHTHDHRKEHEVVDVDVEPENEVPAPSTAQRVNECCSNLRVFGEPRLAAFLFVTWFMGVGVGIVFTFLFWHLQDLDGTPTLFGLASVINHMSEILAYFFSHKVIEKLGHIKVLYLGLIGNIVRFLYVSWLTNPWWILPFEFIQGLTHATVWAACCSYVAQAVPRESRAASQGLLQGIHHGLGKGLGAVFGGLITSSVGSAILFRSYGVCCCVILLLFVVLNYYLSEKMPVTANTKSSSVIPTVPGDESEPKDFLEGSYLSPHGVPCTPANRELSSTKTTGLLSQGQGQPPNYSTETYRPQPTSFDNAQVGYQSGYGY